MVKVAAGRKVKIVFLERKTFKSVVDSGDKNLKRSLFSFLYIYRYDYGRGTEQFQISIEIKGESGQVI